jgi:hypothetical protein
MRAGFGVAAAREINKYQTSADRPKGQPFGRLA